MFLNFAVVYSILFGYNLKHSGKSPRNMYTVILKDSKLHLKKYRGNGI